MNDLSRALFFSRAEWKQQSINIQSKLKSTQKGVKRKVNQKINCLLLHMEELFRIGK